MAARRSDLQIPMWSKPATSKSPRQDSERDLQIPIWTKPSCAHTVEHYLSAVPLHQTEAARHLIAQRELANAKAAQDASSSASTYADDSSDESEIEEETLGAFGAVDASNSDIMDAAPNASKTDVLVAALRDARLRANARRLAAVALVSSTSGEAH